MYFVITLGNMNVAPRDDYDRWFIMPVTVHRCPWLHSHMQSVQPACVSLSGA
jgi:hypothetical protein